MADALLTAPSKCQADHHPASLLIRVADGVVAKTVGHGITRWSGHAFQCPIRTRACNLIIVHTLGRLGQVPGRDVFVNFFKHCFIVQAWRGRWVVLESRDLSPEAIHMPFCEFRAG